MSMNKNTQNSFNLNFKDIETEERTKMGLKYFVHLLYTVVRTLIEFIGYSNSISRVESDRQP